MPFASVNGVRLWYDTIGQGPPLVLVIGYRLPSAAWPQAWLASLAAHHRVIVFDNRGTGMSDKPTLGYAIDNLAQDTLCLMDHVGIARASLLGYSMGGAIVQKAALASPDRVTGLVLCATFCGWTNSVRAAPHVLRRLRDHAGRSPEAVARAMWPITYSAAHLAANPAGVVAQMRREIAFPTPLHVGDLQFQALATFDTHEDLDRIEAPALVMTGSADQLVPPLNSRILAARLPSARLVELEGCGHRVLWEAPQETSAIIGEFLSQSAETAHG